MKSYLKTPQNNQTWELWRDTYRLPWIVVHFLLLLARNTHSFRCTDQRSITRRHVHFYAKVPSYQNTNFINWPLACHMTIINAVKKSIASLQNSLNKAWAMPIVFMRRKSFSALDNEITVMIEVGPYDQSISSVAHAFAWRNEWFWSFFVLWYHLLLILPSRRSRGGLGTWSWCPFPSPPLLPSLFSLPRRRFRSHIVIPL